METKDVVYQGNANVYLEGDRAFLPLELDNPEKIVYSIGAQHTHLVVHDYRIKSNSVARQILSGNTSMEFAEAFNQSAWVEIFQQEGGLEINLHECLSKGQFPILWMGVIRDGKMPVHKLAWEILKPVEEFATAFAALVQNK